MKPKLKILGLLAICLMFLWVACTSLIEWRGAGIPKIVLKPDNKERNGEE